MQSEMNDINNNLQISKRYENNRKSPHGYKNIAYKHSDVHFYSKISYFWLNPLLYKGYGEPLEENDFGEIPENEQSKKDYDNFARIYSKQVYTLITFQM